MGRRRRFVRPVPGEAAAVDDRPAAPAPSARFFSRFHSRVADRAARDTTVRPRAPDLTANSTSCPSKDLARTAK